MRFGVSEGFRPTTGDTHVACSHAAPGVTFVHFCDQRHPQARPNARANAFEAFWVFVGVVLALFGVEQITNDHKRPSGATL